jgi:hypothetical protein
MVFFGDNLWDKVVAIGNRWRNDNGSSTHRKYPYLCHQSEKLKIDDESKR